MQRFARRLAVVTALSTLTAATVAGAGEIASSAIPTATNAR